MSADDPLIVWAGWVEKRASDHKNKLWQRRFLVVSTACLDFFYPSWPLQSSPLAAAGVCASLAQYYEGGTPSPDRVSCKAYCEQALRLKFSTSISGWVLSNAKRLDEPEAGRDHVVRLHAGSISISP